MITWYPQKSTPSSFPVIEELTVAIAADTTSPNKQLLVAKEIATQWCLFA